MKIFDNPNYSTIMAIAIITISLLITFSFLNIPQNKETNTQTEKIVITGYAVEDQPTNFSPIGFYTFIMILLTLIIITTKRLYKTIYNNV